MQSLDKRKTRLIFQSCDELRFKGRSRPVVVEAHPFFARVRLAGMRTTYPISWAAIYHAAARIEAEKARAIKAAARKNKRGS